jgi:L-ectoine synthase
MVDKMILRTLEEIVGTEREVLTANDNSCSRRFLVAKDGMGFSLTDTVMFAGTRSLLHYKHHLEACYCVEGVGRIECVDTGTVTPIRPGTMYALDKHEKHYLAAETEMRLICVFNPPLSGNETHQKDGSYRAPELG